MRRVRSLLFAGIGLGCRGSVSPVETACYFCYRFVTGASIHPAPTFVKISGEKKDNPPTFGRMVWESAGNAGKRRHNNDKKVTE